MGKILFTLLLLCTFHFNGYAQDKGIDAQAASIPDDNCTTVDALASYIKQHYTADTERIRAIYVWTTHHISYDLQRLQIIESNPNTPPQPVADVLKKHRAVCEGYASLFVALCKGVGINAMSVGGYTKMQHRVSPIPHAWVAAELGNDWYLFDPTWGSGYVKDDKFYKSYSDEFYKVTPSVFIADHMPFDPMYQFLSYPLTHKEFIEDTPASSKTLFNYKDSILQNSQLSPIQQMTAELRRLEEAGIQIDVLHKHQLYLKNVLQSFRSNDAFEESGKAVNTAVTMFNEYINHKNKQFKSIGDNDLREMVDSIGYYIKISRSLLLEAVVRTDEQRQAKAGNITNIEHFWNQLKRERQFVEQYLASDETSRRRLFMR